MYVNKSELISNEHLIAWISFQGQNSGYKSAIYTLNSVVDTGVASLILKNIDETYFSNINTEQNRIDEIYRHIQAYLNKQLGKKMKVCLRNKILDGSIQQLVKVLIYCCLHSKKKEEYIERIMLLGQDIQSCIMISMQCIGVNVYSIEDIKQVLIRLQELQNEIQILKNDVNRYQIKQQRYRILIQQLDEEIIKKQKQIKIYKKQKQKVIQKLQLSNFDQYLILYQRLQEQNKIINKYIEELQENNRQNYIIQQQLRKDIQNQTYIILDLNQNITILKQKINNIKLENSIRFSLDDTCDVSRNFGHQLLEKQNISNQKQQKRKSLLSNSDMWLLQQTSFQHQKNREEALQQEMKQLRKYNSDLIHKLQTVYKTHKTLIVQTGLVKQRNQNLIKQNKFYRKQMTQLKKIHERMESEMLSGLI